MLREVIESDLEIFFEQQRDDTSNRMAAFIYRDPNNREVFFAHWKKNLKEPKNLNRTIIWNQEVAGHIVSYELGGQLNVGYWIGKELWGKGIATKALQEFLKIQPRRPIFGHAVKDNQASTRVLEKNGFKMQGKEKAFSTFRNEEVEEVAFILTD